MSSRSLTCGSERNDESRAATRNNPGAPSEAATACIQMRKLFTITIDYRVLSSRALFWWAVAAAFVVGAVTAVHYAGLDLTLSHYDAKGHLVVARRIADSLRPGWWQIGAVWLPLPHLLNAGPVQVDAWYRTGFSGVAMSVSCFALAVGTLVWLIHRATGSIAGAAAGAVVLASQPDVLYLQSTPMTEPLLMALTLGGVALTWRWVADGADDPPTAAGVVLGLACLTRYEAWPITAAAIGAAAVALATSGHPIERHDPARRAPGRLPARGDPRLPRPQQGHRRRLVRHRRLLRRRQPGLPPPVQGRRLGVVGDAEVERQRTVGLGVAGLAARALGDPARSRASRAARHLRAGRLRRAPDLRVLPGPPVPDPLHGGAGDDAGGLERPRRRPAAAAAGARGDPRAAAA